MNMSESATSFPKPCILWAPPRSCSTAMERSVMTHPDVEVFHEHLADSVALLRVAPLVFRSLPLLTFSALIPSTLFVASRRLATFCSILAANVFTLKVANPASACFFLVKA